MLRAVLHEVRDRSSTDDALRFADALPPLVRGIMLERWHPLATSPETRPPFLEAVKARLEPHTPPPDSIVEDVLAVLSQRTQANLLPTLAAHMPAELQPQWRAAVEAAAPEVAFAVVARTSDRRPILRVARFVGIEKVSRISTKVSEENQPLLRWWDTS